jgi:hypothetical protein
MIQKIKVELKTRNLYGHPKVFEEIKRTRIKLTAVIEMVINLIALFPLKK